jgi:hypothetical protein
LIAPSLHRSDILEGRGSAAPKSMHDCESEIEIDENAGMKTNKIKIEQRVMGLGKQMDLVSPGAPWTFTEQRKGDKA